MQQNPPEFGQLIHALNKHGVRFVVVGGVAMVLHGSFCSTLDSDFAVANDPEAKEPIVMALASFHPRPTHFSEGTPFVWDARSIFGAVVSLATDAGDVDLLRILPGVDSFDGLVSRSVIRHIYGEDVHVACIEVLIAMKRAANRPKDRIHVVELEALQEMQRKIAQEGE